MKLKSVLCFLAAGVLMAFAWSLRGQFGHLKGALLPGACAAALMAFCMDGEHWRDSFGRAVIMGAVGFGIGGHIGYGRLFDAVLEYPEIQQTYLSLASIGLIWGALGGTFLGFGFSEKPLSRFDMFLLSSVCLFWFLTLEVWGLEDWDLLLFLCGLAGIHVYNFLFKKSEIVGAFAFGGAFAWGTAFFAAAVLLAVGRQGLLGGGFDWWNLRDQILGFIAGACFWMIASAFRAFRFRRHLAEEILTLQRAGLICYTAVLPAFYAANVCLHWLQTLDTAQVLPYAVIMGAVLLGALIVIIRLDSRRFLKPKFPKTLMVSTFFVLGYCSALAAAKQLRPAGMAAWEPAYTCFVVFFAVLAFLLPYFSKRAAESPDV